MEEVAMYIEFDGVAETGGADLGLFGDAPAPAKEEAGFIGVAWLLSFLTASGFTVGGGGGKGDIEMDETLAEWAWYTRRD
jgi:hypothetical protein